MNKIFEQKINIKTVYFITAVYAGFVLGSLFCTFMNRNLQKYAALDAVMQEISAGKYDLKNHNCVDFSNEAKDALARVGIQSTVIAATPSCGDNCQEKPQHAFIGVWIEPQTGEFVPNDYVFPYIYNN